MIFNLTLACACLSDSSVHKFLFRCDIYSYISYPLFLLASILSFSIVNCYFVSGSIYFLEIISDLANTC
jgi:hypothetical protein